MAVARLKWNKFSDQDWTLYLFFLIGVPVVLGMITGWMQSGRTAEWSKLGSLYFWVIFFVIGWHFSEFFSMLVARFVGRWNWPLWSILVVGFLISQQIAFPLAYLHTNFCEMIFGGGDNFILFFEPTFSQHMSRLIDNLPAGILLWVSINYSFFFAGLPRFGFDSPGNVFWQIQNVDTSCEIPDTPDIIKRLKPEIGTSIFMVKAEKHYLHVYTDLGKDFIHYSLSNAVDDLAESGGLQVHRSYWIKNDAVDHIEKNGRNCHLVLKNGMHVPVGSTYKALVLNAFKT